MHNLKPLIIFLTYDIKRGYALSFVNISILYQLTIKCLLLGIDKINIAEIIFSMIQFNVEKYNLSKFL